MLDKHGRTCSEYVARRPKPPKPNEFLQRLSLNWLLCGATVVLFLGILGGSFTSAVNFLLLASGIYGYQCCRTNQLTNRFRFENWRRRYRIGATLLLFAVVATTYVVGAAAPAFAQFFQNTQQWMQSAFPIGAGGGAGGNNNIYALIFNVLRAIFVIYLAIALVRVIAAARNDEDWQTLARTPLIILITVTLGDILAGFITGGGTGGGGTP